jgi:hypothetical protein
VFFFGQEKKKGEGAKVTKRFLLGEKLAQLLPTL